MIRLLLALEAATFVIAAVAHFGWLFPGYVHLEAAIAESIIAGVLASGLVVTWLRHGWWRPAAIGAQTFALLGTGVGLFFIAIGIGPQTIPDLVYHVGIMIVLATGIGTSVTSTGSTWLAPPI